MKKHLLPLILLAASLSANDHSDETLPDRWRINAGAYLTGDFSTNLDFVSHDGYSAGMNVQELFKMESDLASLYVDGFFRISPYHRIEIGYYGTRTGGSSNSAFTLFGGIENIPDVNISAGANSHFNTSTIKMVYSYSLFHNEEVEAAVSIGLHITAFNVGFQANIEDIGGEFGFAFNQAIPVIGTRLEYHFFPVWSVFYSFDIFALNAGLKLTQNEEGSIPQYLVDNFTGFSGYMSNFDLGTEYRIGDHFGIGATFNYQIQDFSMELKDTYDIGVDSTIVGLALYGTLHF